MTTTTTTTTRRVTVTSYAIEFNGREHQLTPFWGRLLWACGAAWLASPPLLLAVIAWLAWRAG